jgi:hypothetical protein
MGGVGAGIFKVFEGNNNAQITKDQALAQYIQGFAQMAQQTISQTAANIQSKEQLEQGAAQAFLQAEQLANSRG